MESKRAVRDRDQVFRRVAELVTEIAHVPLESVHEDLTITDDLKLESVAFVELQVAIETDYGVELDPIVIVELDRLGDIVDYIASLPGRVE